ncbi:endosialidase [Candidatus Epulonipiscium viviparus]|uniref:endosialidase n=1 Tax=Candidatus Epulonipiscium viviparus TaxID=420336 RepID=UPI002738076B|nr:endosialidase [Candidatus Epulopiscium viviparus]
MAIVEELIRVNDDGSLSFGNYLLPAKDKVEEFIIDGVSFKAKTFNEVTKLKREGQLVYESIPGTAVHHFSVSDEKVYFTIEGYAPTGITLELTPSTTYQFKIDGQEVALVKTTATGKVSIHVDAVKEPQTIELIKK